MMQTKHLVRSVQKICVKAFVQDKTKKYFKSNKTRKISLFWSSNCPSIFRRNVLAFGGTATSKEKKSHFKALGCFTITTLNQVQVPVGQQ